MNNHETDDFAMARWIADIVSIRQGAAYLAERGYPVEVAVSQLAKRRSA